MYQSRGLLISESTGYGILFNKIEFTGGNKMGKSFVYGQIRRASRNLIIVNCFILFLVFKCVRKDIMTIIAVKELVGSISIYDLKYYGVQLPIMFVEIIIMAINLWNIVRGIKCLFEPKYHKIYKLLSGGYYSIEAIDDEMSSNEGERFGNTIILPSWVIGKTYFGITVVKVNDILWVYKKTTKNYMNCIPMGKSFDLVMGLSNRGFMTVTMRQKYVDKAINYIKDRYPWIITGYSEEMNATWERRFYEFSSYVNSNRRPR